MNQNHSFVPPLTPAAGSVRAEAPRAPGASWPTARSGGWRPIPGPTRALAGAGRPGWPQGYRYESLPDVQHTSHENEAAGLRFRRSPFRDSARRAESNQGESLGRHKANLAEIPQARPRRRRAGAEGCWDPVSAWLWAPASCAGAWSTVVGRTKIGRA